MKPYLTPLKAKTLGSEMEGKTFTEREASNASLRKKNTETSKPYKKLKPLKAKTLGK